VGVQAGIDAGGRMHQWMWKEDPEKIGAAVWIVEEPSAPADCDPAKEEWRFAYCLQAALSGN
jgi:hypothetical protein